MQHLSFSESEIKQLLSRALRLAGYSVTPSDITFVVGNMRTGFGSEENTDPDIGIKACRVTCR